MLEAPWAQEGVLLALRPSYGRGGSAVAVSEWPMSGRPEDLESPQTPDRGKATMQGIHLSKLVHKRVVNAPLTSL